MDESKETTSPAAEAPAAAAVEPRGEEQRRYVCLHMHGIKYRGKRIRNRQEFDAYPSEMEGFGHLRNGVVEEVQTSANGATGATGHSEDEEA